MKKVNNFEETENLIAIHCNKDYRGGVDIRSHVVERAIKNNKSIKVTCDTLNGESIYSPEELANNAKISKNEYESKYDGSKYKLHTYKWKGT